MMLRKWWINLSALGLLACQSSTPPSNYTQLARMLAEYQKVETPWIGYSPHQDAISPLHPRWFDSLDLAFSDQDTAEPLGYKAPQSCVGISLAALIHAETLGIPMEAMEIGATGKGVGHVYLRLCDSVGYCQNWEPNRRGYAHPDSHYLRSYGAMGKPLDRTGFAALVFYEAANRQRQNVKLAERLYRKSIALTPRADAQGNLAVVLAQRGEYAEAVAMLGKLADDTTQHPYHRALAQKNLDALYAHTKTQRLIP